MGLLQDQLDVAPVARGWALTPDRTWWGHNALFGGYAQAMVLAAMQAELAASTPAGIRPMPVRSMTMHFVRPFQDGEYALPVEVVRHGRTMANVTARAEADGKLMGLALANFGAERDVPISNFVDIDPPAFDPPGPHEDSVAPGVGVPTHELFDFYPRLGGLSLGRDGDRGGGRALVGGWVRPRFHAPVDEALLTVLADLWTPATYQRWEHPLVAVSIDITLHFRSEVPADLEPGAPLAVRLRTSQSRRGIVDEDGEVWSPAGRLLLQSRQMRYVTELPSPGPSGGGS